MAAAATCSTIPAVARSPSVETRGLSDSAPAVGKHHVPTGTENGPGHRNSQPAGADDPNQLAIRPVHHGRSSYSDANR